MTVFYGHTVRRSGIYGAIHLGLFGLQVKRPENTRTPADYDLTYEKLRFACSDGSEIEMWKILRKDTEEKSEPYKISVSFNWFGGSKDDLLEHASALHDAGFEVWLGDLHGHGGASGNTTSLGWHESRQVAEITNYIRNTCSPHKLLLHGISLSAVAITRAFYLYEIPADAIILECPYDRLINTVKLRVKSFHFPATPLAHTMLALGSLQQRFNAFKLNPVVYAQAINCPALIMHSGADPFITTLQARSVADSCSGPSMYREFPGVQHGSVLLYNKQLWIDTVNGFLKSYDL